LFLDTARLGCWPQRHQAQWSDNYRQAGGSGVFDDFFSLTYNNLAICDELKQAIEFFPLSQEAHIKVLIFSVFLRQFWSWS
jgi:hypothetical protein